MQAIITVIGRDKPGILAAVSSCCFQSGVNIIDITQTIMDRMFVMVMHTGMEGMNCGFDQFTQRMQDVAKAAENWPYNRIEPGDRTLGIITAGVAYQYALLRPSPNADHYRHRSCQPERTGTRYYQY